MIATKEQERKALEEIRKIVKSLGDDSYIASAFDGCFGDAEENIQYDMANSYKGRFNMVNEELKAERKKTVALEREINRLKEENEKLSSCTITDEDLESCIALADSDVDNWKAKERTAAQKIVELAEQSQTTEFKDTVHEHRLYSIYVTSSTKLRERLIAARLARN